MDCKHKKITETLDTKQSLLLINKMIIHHGYGTYESYCDECEADIESAVCLNAIVWESNTHG